jgi:hypothetical protein
MTNGLFEFLKTFAWPIVAVVALILFQAPLRQIIDQVPDLLSRSESIKIADVEIRAKRLALPDPDLRDIVSSLSFGDVRFILDNQISSGLQITRSYEALSPTEKAEWSRLTELKLATPLTKSQIDQINTTYHSNNNWGVVVSDNLVRIREYLLALMSNILKDIGKPGGEQASDEKPAPSRK